ncbi:MAG: alpha-ketoacid dehydrogenase subunit beta, partial [Acidimicrobiia bacterium]|nr:alpha-ketoacid dehydrogenase subunit beta [Acidimicrobiia bacterium]
LAAEGIHTEVIDLRSLVPMDEDAILASVGRTRRAVIVHEAVRRGGLGAEIASLINEHLFGHLDAPVLRVAGPNTPIPYAAELEREFLVDAAKIAAGVREAVK